LVGRGGFSDLPVLKEGKKGTGRLVKMPTDLRGGKGAVKLNG